MVANAIDLELGRHAMELALEKWGKPKPIGPHLSVLLPLVPKSDLQRRWHVVQTEPQQESKVADRISEADVDSYAPTQPKSIRMSIGKRKIIRRPMLPGYIFVGFDARFDPWESICDMRGVLKLFMVALRPVPVLDEQIERIRLRQKWKSITGAGCRRPRCRRRSETSFSLLSVRYFPVS